MWKKEGNELITSNTDLFQSYGKYTVRDTAGVLEVLYDAAFSSQEDNHEKTWLLCHQFRQLLKNVLISVHVSVCT